MWVYQPDKAIMKELNEAAKGEVSWFVQDRPSGRFVTLKLRRGDKSKSVALTEYSVGPGDHWNYIDYKSLEEGLAHLEEMFWRDENPLPEPPVTKKELREIDDLLREIEEDLKELRKWYPRKED